jgi:ankyrin repeat protein
MVMPKWSKFFLKKIAVQALVANKFIKVDAKNNAEMTALMLASSGGHTEAVKVLLSKGADTKLRNKLDSTPLMFAVLNKHAATVEVLLEAKANPNATRSDGRTPMYIAKEKNYSEIVDLLKKAGALDVKIPGQ